MGIGLAVFCRECDYSRHIELGVGMRYAPENILDFESGKPMLWTLIRSRKTVEQIKALVEEERAVMAGRYGHYIYRCPECGELHSRFFIHLDYSGGSFEPVYRCGRCRSTLSRVDHLSGEGFFEERIAGIIASLPCPECGRRSLQIDDAVTIMWD